MRGRKGERHARDASACDQRKAVAAEVKEVDAALLVDSGKLVAARVKGHRLKGELVALQVLFAWYIDAPGGY
jgi:hypothetical protein